MIVVIAQRNGFEPSNGPAPTPAAGSATVPKSANAETAAAFLIVDVMAHSISMGAPRPAGPQPRDGLRRALPLAGTRGGSLHGVAAPLQTRGVRAVVVGLLLAGLRLLLRHCGLILPVLLVAPHRTEHRAGPGAYRGALPRVAADRAADRAHRRAAGGPADRAPAGRRRGRRGLGRRRVIAALLQRPAVTLGLVLLLLLLALTFLWIRVDLLAARRARQEAADEDAG